MKVEIIKSNFKMHIISTHVNLDYIMSSVQMYEMIKIKVLSHDLFLSCVAFHF